MRALVVIAIVCIGGTATGRDQRRKPGRKTAGSSPATAAPAQPAAEVPPPPKREFIPSFSETGCFPHFKRGDRVDPPPVPAAVVPTTTLTGAEVVAGFHAIERTVKECMPGNPRPDPLSIHAAIAKDGKVLTVTPRGQFTGATASCIENAVKGAHFRASSGLAADYVFLFRRIESGAGQGGGDGGVDGGRDAGADGTGQ